MNLSNNHGNTAVTVVVIFIVVIIMFGLPLKTIADKKDNTIMLEAQKVVSETANKWRTVGVITQEDLDNLNISLASTGGAFEVELKVLVVDTNPAKKSTGSRVTIGNIVYIEEYTTQIEEKLPYILNEGSIVTLIAIRTDISIADSLDLTALGSGAHSSSKVEETVVCTTSAK